MRQKIGGSLQLPLCGDALELDEVNYYKLADMGAYLQSIDEWMRPCYQIPTLMMVNARADSVFQQLTKYK